MHREDAHGPVCFRNASVIRPPARLQKTSTRALVRTPSHIPVTVYAIIIVPGPGVTLADRWRVPWKPRTITSPALKPELVMGSKGGGRGQIISCGERDRSVPLGRLLRIIAMADRGGP